MVRSPRRWPLGFFILIPVGALLFITFCDRAGNTEHPNPSETRRNPPGDLKENNLKTNHEKSSQIDSSKTSGESEVVLKKNPTNPRPETKVDPPIDRLKMRGPRVSDFEKHLRTIERQTRWFKGKKALDKAPFIGIATDYRPRIYPNTRARGSGISYVRRGSQFPVKRAVGGTRCEGGQWYKHGGPGFICTSRGFSVYPRGKVPPYEFVAADPYSPEPYEYAKITDRNALQYRSPPNREERKRAEEIASKGGRLPGYVVRRLDGDATVAIGGTETVAGHVYIRTPSGSFIPKEATERFPVNQMHGEILGPGNRLPIAFVYKEETKVYRIEDGKPVLETIAEKHTRFNVKKTIKNEEGTWVLNPEKYAVRREDVRICRKRKQPSRLRGTNRWIHVDLSEQTIVAYKGETPVFATLISSGIPSRPTPTGFYRINYKQVTTTMSGPCDKYGWYDVAEVPWAMYYRNLYAIHGAYWHEDFGIPKSKGCTNMAPADAKWLFHWTKPNRPVGWHSIRDAGTHVWFSK